MSQTTKSLARYKNAHSLIYSAIVVVSDSVMGWGLESCDLYKARCSPDVPNFRLDALHMEVCDV